MATEKKIYPLTLTRNYVSDWTVTDAVREIFQNAIDNEAGWEYKIISPKDGEDKENHSILVTSFSTDLPVSTLLLGNSGKAKDATKVGQFGEGYKLAALVLTREGKELKVFHPGNKAWDFEFAFEPTFGCEMLRVSEYAASYWSEFLKSGLGFLIEGLTSTELEAIKQMYLPAHEEHAVIKYKTPFGNILANKPGQLFVKGLFVCETELVYGYDLNPDQIQLGRDRQVVDSWNLRWKTKDLWISAVSGSVLIQMMKEEIPDVELIEYVASSTIPGFGEAVKNMVFSGNRAAYYPASSESQKNVHIKNGVPASKIMLVPSRLMSIIEEQEWYGKLFKKNAKKKAPYKVLSEWLKRNDTHLTNYGKRNFTELLTESKDWIYK